MIVGDIFKIRPQIDRAMVGVLTTSFAGQATLIVSGVIVARVLGPSNRGHLAAFVLIATIFSFTIAAGMPTAAAFEIAAGKRTVRGILRELHGVLALQALLLLVLPTITLLLIYLRSDVLAAALVTLPMALAGVGVAYSLAFLQGQQRFGLFNMLRILPAVLYALAVLVGYVLGTRSLEAFSLIQSSALTVAAVAIVLLAVRGNDPADQVRHSVRPLLSYGIKAQVGANSPLESFRLDQVVVATLVGPAGLGVYVVAAAFTNLPTFVAQSIGMVLFPRVAERVKSGGKKQIILEAVLLTAVLAGAIVLALALTVHMLIPFFFGDQYRAAIPISRILLVAAFFLAMRRVVGDAMRGAGLPMPGTAAEAVSWVVFVAAAIPLAISYDGEGVAAAMALSAAVSVLYLSGSATRIALRRARSAEMPTPSG